MSEVHKPILVFGATGRQGFSVARALRQGRWPVRELVRNPHANRSVALRDAGVEPIQGSFADADVIHAAMTGAHGVSIVLPGSSTEEEEVRSGIAIANLAVESGIAHLVYSSGASAGRETNGCSAVR